MKTLNNLFGKNSVNEISFFSNYSLSEMQMMAIKGGAEPKVDKVELVGENPPPRDI